MKTDESNFDNTGYEDCITLNDFVRKIARKSLWVWGDLIETVHNIMGHMSNFESDWDMRDVDEDFSPYLYSDLDVMVDNIMLVPDNGTFKVFQCGIVPFPLIDVEVHLKISLSRHSPATIDISIGGISLCNERGLNLHYDVIHFCDNLDMCSMGDYQQIRKLGRFNIGKALAALRNEDLSSIFDEVRCEGECMRKFTKFHLSETGEDHPRLLCSECHTDYYNILRDRISDESGVK